MSVGSTVIHSFTVNNTGPGTLTISKLKVPKGFKVVDKLASSIASGESDTFSLQLDTKKAELKTGQITFTTNDADEAAFNFALMGNVTAPAASRFDDASGGQATDALVAIDQLLFEFEDQSPSQNQNFLGLAAFDLV